jgi:hypothetical protein
MPRSGVGTATSAALTSSNVSERLALEIADCHWRAVKCKSVGRLGVALSFVTFTT